MNWRPEGWKNPYEGASKKCEEAYPKGIPKGYHILQEVGFEEGFEAGADAMLNAACEGIEKVANDHYWDSLETEKPIILKHLKAILSLLRSEK